MSFSKVVNELQGWMKILPSSTAKSIVNKAREEIYNEQNWSFLLQETYLIVPAVIRTGTFNINKYALTGVVSNDLKAILNAITVNEVPIIGRQFRIIDNAISKRIIYTITDYNSSSGTITFDNPYLGNTNTTARIEIFKSYYNPPFYKNNEIDFKSFLAIGDLTDRRRLSLDYSIERLNNFDVDRNTSGNPYALVPYKLDKNGNQLFEFYPHYKSSIDRIYRILYIRNGKDYDIQTNNNIPYPLSDNLLLSLSKIKAAEWAEMNKNREGNESLLKTNWIALISMWNPANPIVANTNKTCYPYLLQEAKRRDDELFNQSYVGSFVDWNYYDDFSGLMSPENPPREILIISF